MDSLTTGRLYVSIRTNQLTFKITVMPIKIQFVTDLKSVGSWMQTALQTYYGTQVEMEIITTDNQLKNIVAHNMAKIPSTMAKVLIPSSAFIKGKILNLIEAIKKLNVESTVIITYHATEKQIQSLCRNCTTWKSDFTVRNDGLIMTLQKETGP